MEVPLTWNTNESEVHSMFKHDGEGAIVWFIFGAVIVCLIVYLVVLLATIIVGAAAAGGTLYGGGYAIKNYALSFKENVIDNNRASVMAA